MKIIFWIVAVLVGLVLLGVVGLWVASKRSDAGRYHVAVEFNAPPDQVWQWINDPEKFRQWVSWTATIKDDGDGLTQVGRKRTMIMEDANNNNQKVEIVSTVTEIVPGKMMKLKVDSPKYGFTGEITYTTTDLGNNRTKMDYDSYFQYNSAVFSLMEPLITPSARKKSETDIGKMKALVEAAQKK